MKQSFQDEESCDTVQESCDSDTASNAHSAGYDALMTGYIFACFALNTCDHLHIQSPPTNPGQDPSSINAPRSPPSEEQQPTLLSKEADEATHTNTPPSQLLVKLEEKKNCLYNLGFGWGWNNLDRKRDVSKGHHHDDKREKGGRGEIGARHASAQDRYRKDEIEQASGRQRGYGRGKRSGFRGPYHKTNSDEGFTSHRRDRVQRSQPRH